MPMDLLKSLLLLKPDNNLLHLSLTRVPEGVWIPKLPDGPNDSSELEETDIARISCAPTITQAFQAIYPNVSKFFEDDNLRYLDFFMYRPMLTVESRIIGPQELTARRYVWDAHVTGEHGILTPTDMKLVGRVRVQNSNGMQDLFACPFNDTNSEAVFIGPASINYTFYTH